LTGFSSTSIKQGISPKESLVMSTQSICKSKVSNRFNGRRTRITPQNVMPGDEFVMRGQSNGVVYSVDPSKDGNLLTVVLPNGESFARFYGNDTRVSIVEYPNTQARRRAFSRNGVLRSIAAANA
jgi:hypothetical protein